MKVRPVNILTALYLAAVVLATLPVFAPHPAELAGIYALLATWPWSWFSIPAFDSMGWLDTRWGPLLLIASSAIVNVALLQLMAAGLRRLWSRRARNNAPN